MKHYVGERTDRGCEVDVIDAAAPGGGHALDPRLDLRNHSPSGFEWHYNGSGPAQLALALLADALGDDERAQASYQDFKFRVVARLPDHGWELSPGGDRPGRGRDRGRAREAEMTPASSFFRVILDQRYPADRRPDGSRPLASAASLEAFLGLNRSQG